MKGAKKSPETKEKMSLAQRGRKLPQHSGPLHWHWNHNRKEQEDKNKSIRVFRHLLRKTLKRMQQEKTSDSMTMLGYSANDLRIHIERLWEPGMNWENYGMGEDKWCLDHIKPVSSFPIDSPPSVVNNLSNIQPMWWIQNLIKGAKIIDV